MSTAGKMTLPPRYGSAAEVSALTGLSVKTVRRRVADGTLRAVKLGRRVCIPFDAIDRPRTKENPTVAIAPSTVSPHRSVDASGRALPMTDAEIRARAEVAIRALDEIAGMTDETDTDEVWEQFESGIDEDRLSDRKRFR